MGVEGLLQGREQEDKEQEDKESGMQEALPEKMRKAHPPPAALPTNLGKSSCQGAPGVPAPQP